MKKIILIIFIFILSCSQEEAQKVTIEKLSDRGNIFSISQFLDIGFKKNKEYKINDLPGSNSAYFGFIKNNLGEFEDYEIRFYSNHEDAIKLGKDYADNITGKNGCISKDCTLWEEGLKDRIRMSDLGTLLPKYMSYLIYDNFILFCPGYNEIEGQLNCNFVIENINN